MFLHFPDGFSTSFCMFAEGSISSLAPAVPTNQLCTSGAGCEGVNGDHPFLLMSNTPRVSPQTTRSWGPILNQRFCKVLCYIRRVGKGFTLRMRIADSVFNPGIAAMETPKADTSCTAAPTYHNQMFHELPVATTASPIQRKRSKGWLWACLAKTR